MSGLEGCVRGLILSYLLKSGKAALTIEEQNVKNGHSQVDCEPVL